MKVLPQFFLITVAFALLGCDAGSKTGLSHTGLKATATVLISKNARLESVISKQEALLTKRPTDEKTMNTLALAYIQKARETGDPAWYVKGRSVLEKAVLTHGTSTASLHNLAYAKTIFHDFTGAIELAQRAIALDPGDADAYGVLCDSYFELGKYENAADAAQMMVDLKPGLASYSRGAQVRWIMGNPKGAMALMQKAIDAGGTYPENTAWCRIQLATMAFQTGNVLQAEQLSESVLKDLPDYRHAQAVLAKVRIGQGKFDEATELLKRATADGASPAYVIELADLYKRVGKVELAAREVEKLSELRDNHLQYGIAGDELFLGVAMVDHHGDMKVALELLKSEAQSHDSIAANSAYAWALLKSGRATEAKASIVRAMRTNVQDALVWYRAACIERALGNTLESRQLLARAQSLNPNFSTLYVDARHASL